jgi:hypothetical protein
MGEAVATGRTGAGGADEPWQAAARMMIANADVTAGSSRAPLRARLANTFVLSLLVSTRWTA